MEMPKSSFHNSLLTLRNYDIETDSQDDFCFDSVFLLFFDDELKPAPQDRALFDIPGTISRQVSNLSASRTAVLPFALRNSARRASEGTFLAIYEHHPKLILSDFAGNSWFLKPAHSFVTSLHRVADGHAGTTKN
jgi:hypothetical protein